MYYHPAHMADLTTKDYLIICTLYLELVAPVVCLNQIIKGPLMEVLFKELECLLTKLLQAFTFFSGEKFSLWLRQ